MVSHDAHPHGAQMLALAIMKTLRELGYEVTAIVLGEGVLLDDYARVADVHCIRETAADAERLDALLARLRAEGCGLAIANTTVSGSIVPALKDHAFTVVSLVHELPRLLREYGLQSQAEAIAARSDAVVFAAQMVRRKFEEFAGPVAGNALVRPQGMYLPPAPDADRAASIRKGLREKLGLAPDSFVVLGVGYADHRKGLDLFVSACAAAIGRDARIFAVWVGHCDETLLAAQREEIARLGLQDRFVFTGRVTNPGDYYLAGDCLALTSREDPFPSTVMEALDAGRPVVGFSGAGGFEDLLTRGCGVLVPAFDTHAFAAALVELAGDRARAQELASTGREIVRREFRMAPYVNDLISCAGVPRPEVSVVVPNYNYARYLPERLASVVDQSQRPGEIIILDDASTDESIEVIERAMAASPVPWTLVRAEKNSGSPFAQWLKGAEMARGELLWIAEADDIASPRFLEQVRTCFQDTDVVMAYTQSRQIDSHGRETSPDYLDYVADIDPQRWRSAYACDGREEIARALYLKNTVPNVSAAVFRRQAFLETFIACEDEIRGYRNAGDWVFYLRLLEKGKIAFCAQALNAHRRHDGSVTISSFDVDHLAEIVRVQSETIRRFELDEDATAKAREYAQELYERFAIASAERPHFLDHPKLRAAGS